jgi:hypothetical protein
MTGIPSTLDSQWLVDDNLSPLLDGEAVVATNVVNLDALIFREDLAVLGDPSKAPPRTTTIRVTDLEFDSFFYRALRKPDFQRETSNWSPQKICDLVRTFLNGELVPAIILWAAGENVFVIDGAHRLSALIAWINDDYGDRFASRTFFENKIPEPQIRAAERTRALINKEIRSYGEHKAASAHPANSNPEVVAKAKLLGSLSLELQWVRAGDAEKAEAAFFKINQEATPIDPTELRILKSRKAPNAIAARAIVRSGTGHKYWSHFSESAQLTIESLAAAVYGELYTPPLEMPIKTLDIPVAGRGYGAQTLPLIFNLVNLANGIKITDAKKGSGKKKIAEDSENDMSINNDTDGSATIKFLGKTQKVVTRISSDKAGSLGLHPALYFWGQTGNFHPSGFLGAVSFVIWLDENEKLSEFTAARKVFEDFLIIHKTIVTDIVHKFGSGGRSVPWIKLFYERLLDWISVGADSKSVIDHLNKDSDFGFLVARKPAKALSKPGNKFGRKTKSAVYLNEALSNPVRCRICGGLLHRNSVTTDHVQNRADGGTAAMDNGQVAHPYCNHTYKRERDEDRKTA